MRSLSAVIVLLYLPLYLMAQSTGINLPASTLPNTMLDVNGSVSFREGTAWILVNGVNNDVTLANYSFFRVTGPTAAFSVTGFTNGTDGRALTIVNATTQTMTVSHLTGSSAANQINTGGSAIALLPNGVITMIYNSITTKWMVSATNGSNNDWGLGGNAGTTAGTNFLGTTNGQDLVLKTNSIEAMRLTTAQNVGIGNTPLSTARLQVEAVGTNHAIYAPIGTNYNHFAGRTAFGRAFTTPTPTFVGTAADAFWHFQDSITTLGANIAEGLGVKLRLVPSASSSTTLAYGINSRIHTQAYNSANAGTVLAGNFDFRHYGTGTISAAHGLISRAVVIGTGRINKAYGISVDVGNYGGTIDSAWGVHITEGGFGTATNTTYARGIHIADLTSADAYGIWQGGANDKNYFNGYVGFGTEIPLARMHMVSNDAGSGNDLRIDAYNDADAPNISVGRGRGTNAAPTNLVNGDIMGGLNIFGYAGGTSNWLSGMYGQYKGDGTTTLSNLSFRTSATTQMTLNENGRLGIGTNTPANKLDVEGSVAIGTTYAGSITAPVNGLLVEGNVGMAATLKVGGTPSSIDANSLLELESTTKGFVPPRMTTAQMTTLSGALVGSIIYNTTLECLHQKTSSGWLSLCNPALPFTYEATQTTLLTQVFNSAFANIPGISSLSVTVPRTAAYTIYAKGYFASDVFTTTSSNSGAQGSYKLVVDGTSYEETYLASVGVYNASANYHFYGLGAHGNIVKVLNLTAGTHIISIQGRTWFGTNCTAGTWGISTSGYVNSGGVDAGKCKLIIIEN